MYLGVDFHSIIRMLNSVLQQNLPLIKLHAHLPADTAAVVNYAYTLFHMTQHSY